jgi:nucleoside-diphosphate-sugar epimerase
MRVLVTGASGCLGSGVIEGLSARGVSVVAFSRTPPASLPSDTTFISGDIRDAEAVRRAMQGCDVAAHFAWVVRPLRSGDETQAINVGGTRNVLDAMEDTGCGRLVFASSVLAYGARPDNPDRLTESSPLRPNPGLLYSEGKAAAEALIEQRGVANARCRSTMIVGRGVSNYNLDLGALPFLVRGEGTTRMQMLHEEDAVRFHVLACLSDVEGPVNVASEDVVHLDEGAEIAGKRILDLPPRVVDGYLATTWRLGLSDIDPTSKDALAYWPVVDCTQLSEKWGFACVWDTRAALRDFARSTMRTRFVGRRLVEPPWRFRLARPAPSPAAGPESDDSLGVSRLGRDLLARAYEASAPVLGDNAPGASLAQRSLFGDRAWEAAAPALARATDAAKPGRRHWIRAAGLRRERRLLERDERELAMSDTVLPALHDEELAARIDLLADLFIHSATVLAVAEAVVARVLASTEPGPSLAAALQTGEVPAGAALAVEVVHLGRALEGRLDLADVAKLNPSGLMDAMDDRSPAAAARVRELLASCAGWRIDPADIASPVLTDPRILVAAGLRATSLDRVTPPTDTRRASPARRAVAGLLAQRFAARRLNEQFAVRLRAAVLERGARLAGAGVLPSADDAFRLTLAQLAGPPAEMDPTGPRPRFADGPELAVLGTSGPLVLATANVTLPLTALVPAVDTVVGWFDTPRCDGAVAASYLGLPFLTGQEGAVPPSTQILTVGATNDGLMDPINQYSPRVH